MISSPSEAIEAFHLAFLAQLSKDPNKAVVKGGQNLRLFFENYLRFLEQFRAL